MRCKRGREKRLPVSLEKDVSETVAIVCERILSNYGDVIAAQVDLAELLEAAQRAGRDLVQFVLAQLEPLECVCAMAKKRGAK